MTRAETPWVPAPRDGVAASQVRVGDGRHASVLLFLQARFPAVADWPERLARGDVLDSRGQPAAAQAPCWPGLLLWYWRSPPPEQRLPFELQLLHHDAHLVVVDKPHFMATAPVGRHLQETALVRAKRLLGIDTLAPMHRLDRDTAGVLVFTVQPATRHAYQALLQQRRAHKVYEAVAPWRAGLAWPQRLQHRLSERPGEAFMQMQVTPGAPNAETWVELLAQLGAWAHYRLLPHTGRKHQLRAQMAALGLPIAGDRIYPTLLPDTAADAPPDYSQPLQLLARSISFVDPISGQPRHFESRRQLQRVADAATLQPCKPA